MFIYVQNICVYTGMCIKHKSILVLETCISILFPYVYIHLKYLLVHSTFPSVIIALSFYNNGISQHTF